MRALVVYESMYGNTAAVGEAIAAGLRAHGLEVEEGLVSKLDPAAATGVDVLVAGGPTHVHGMSRAQTRRTAADDEKNTFAEPTVEPGLREWLDEVAPGDGRLAAAFDTRIDKPAILTGSAAKAIRRRLAHRGFELAARPESFLVTTQNSLLDGELARAEAWAAELADRVRADESAEAVARQA